METQPPPRDIKSIIELKSDRFGMETVVDGVEDILVDLG